MTCYVCETEKVVYPINIKTKTFYLCLECAEQHKKSVARCLAELKLLRKFEQAE